MDRQVSLVSLDSEYIYGQSEMGAVLIILIHIDLKNFANSSPYCLNLFRQMKMHTSINQEQKGFLFAFEMATDRG